MPAFEVFESLGSEPRLCIVNHLIEVGSAQSVNDIAVSVGGSTANVSRHLTHLKRAKVVSAQAAGQQRLYTVAPWVADLIYNVEVQVSGNKKPLNEGP